MRRRLASVSKHERRISSHDIPGQPGAARLAFGRTLHHRPVRQRLHIAQARRNRATTVSRRARIRGARRAADDRQHRRSRGRHALRAGARSGAPGRPRRLARRRRTGRPARDRRSCSWRRLIAFRANAMLVRNTAPGRTTLRLGMFMMPLHPPGRSMQAYLAEDTEKAILLDMLGYDELWVGEHFTAGTEPYPSPLMFMANLLARTERLTFATGVVNAPNRHP